MLRSWYQKLAAKKAPTSGRLRQRASRRRIRYRPQLEPLEARLVLYDHVWGSDCIIVCGGRRWDDEDNWSNGSPFGDPDPSGAVVIFPAAVDSSWDLNYYVTDTPTPIRSMYYHRGNFNTAILGGGGENPILLSHDIFTDLGGTNHVEPKISFTEGYHEIQVNDGGILELRGDLSSGAGANVTKDGNGTLSLYGNNQNFTGYLNLAAGNIRLEGPNALTSATNVEMQDVGAILDLNNFDLTLNPYGFGTDRADIRLGSGNLTLDSGAIWNYGGSMSGTGGLTLNGNAYVDLAGTQTYTGPTQVNWGTLHVDGSLPAGNIVTVGAVGLTQAVLSGRGQVGSLTVYGTVVPGDPPDSGGAPGVLSTMGHVVFEAGSLFGVRLQGTHPGGSDGYDQLHVGGAVDLSTGPTLRVGQYNGFTAAEGDTFTILQSSDHITGTFAGLPDNTVFAIQGAPFQIHYTGTSVVLTRVRQFLPPAYYAAGGSPVDVVTGDFDSDGKADLAVADATGPVDVSVLLDHNGDGTFQSPLPLHTPQGNATRLAVGHFHDPHISDLVVTEPDQIDVFLCNGDGTFQAPLVYRVDNQHSQVIVGAVVGDVNGDGSDDIVMWNSNSRIFSILYGNGDGTFQDPVPVDFSGPGNVQTMVLAAINGRLDLVAGVRLPGGSDSVIKVFVNQGNDSAGHAQFLHGPTDDYLVPNTDIYVVGAGDFDGDGIPDVIFGDGNSHYVGVFLGQSDGTLQGPPRLSFADYAAPYDSPLAIGDFDGDGKLDISGPSRNSREVVLYGNGDGTFGPPSYYQMQDSTWATTTGDFNGDGSPDLAVVVHNGQVGILLNAVGGGGGGAPGGGGSAPRQPRTALVPFYSMPIMRSDLPAGGEPAARPESGGRSDIRESYDIQAILDFRSTLAPDTYDNRVGALVAGTTDYDTSDQWQQAFMAIMNEWT